VVHAAIDCGGPPRVHLFVHLRVHLLRTLVGAGGRRSMPARRTATVLCS